MATSLPEPIPLTGHAVPKQFCSPLSNADFGFPDLRWQVAIAGNELEKQGIHRGVGNLPLDQTALSALQTIAVPHKSANCSQTSSMHLTQSIRHRR